MPSGYLTLKNYHRVHRDDFPESLSLRVHRALSWLARAQQDDEGVDARFIFLWVAFNAAYAQDLSRIDAVADEKGLDNGSKCSVEVSVGTRPA